ncbi:MAG TPA: AAA family ATPase [Steroidobacteraceae bacterium]|nr:AAA family ATPase [Steroidobacteraceae bacterium]
MNYLKHFGLRELPFGITPDTSYFFACRSIQEALNTLLIAVANGEGFIKITGEVGTGKTLLCRKFLSTLGQNWVSAYIPNPNVEPRVIQLALAEELGVSGSVEPHRLEKDLTQRLLDIARQGKRMVLCMDETQAMPLATLETVRLLTNLETEKRKLMQVVLFGQPELDRKLESESVRQLRQRITFQYTLKALARHEVAQYVAHRLTIAGYSGPALFTDAALKAIHLSSRGVPRLVNILAHKALLLTYGEGARRAERRHVRVAVDDTPAATTPWWWFKAA